MGIASWATLREPDYTPQPFTEAAEHARKIASSLDTDEDGELSVIEVQSRFPRHHQEAVDAIRYHDVNADGHTVIDEFVQTFAAWSAVEHKAQQDGVNFDDLEL